jgi:hypothetical protein
MDAVRAAYTDLIKAGQLRLSEDRLFLLN